MNFGDKPNGSGTAETGSPAPHCPRSGMTETRTDLHEFYTIGGPGSHEAEPRRRWAPEISPSGLRQADGPAGSQEDLTCRRGVDGDLVSADDGSALLAPG